MFKRLANLKMPLLFSPQTVNCCLTPKLTSFPNLIPLFYQFIVKFIKFYTQFIITSLLCIKVRMERTIIRSLFINVRTKAVILFMLCNIIGMTGTTPILFYIIVRMKRLISFIVYIIVRIKRLISFKLYIIVRMKRVISFLQCNIVSLKRFLSHIFQLSSHYFTNISLINYQFN